MRPPIAIVGGGPAGCAAALTLRRYLPHLVTVLLTRTVTPGTNTPMVGETLSPGALPLLEYLGLRDEFLRLGHLPAGGTASAWGSGHLVERSYLFTGRGHGWHLDRAAFDAWLLSRVQEAGARCLQSRAVSAGRSDGVWRIALEGGENLAASAVVDATGRTAWLSRQQSDAPRKDDGLVAEARWFQHDQPEVHSNGPLVESVPDGWWYSATLPGRRGVAMFMTDHDLRPQTSGNDRLAAAPATRTRLASWVPAGHSVVRAAHSQCSPMVVGEGWVAAGDAAAAFDPISALGIGFSLRSGMEAARVAVAALENEAGPGAGYASSLARIYSDYRQRLQAIYRLERRWPDNPFWARRQK